MPIITKAGSPVKGSPTQFTLDKTALAAVTSVAADSYYSDSSNWNEVSLVYKSSTGNQSEIVKFDASLASPTANFAVSLKARDIFQIHKITIKDFDGGIFEVPRSALTTAEFDVDMGSSVTYIDYNLLYGSVATNALGAVSVTGTSSDFAKATSISYIGQDFSFSFNVEASLPNEFFCGVSDSTSNASGSSSFGFFNIGTPNVIATYIAGSMVEFTTLLPSGNVFKIERVSGDVRLYVNNVVVFALIGFNPSIETFPAVRPMTGTPVTSSTVS